MMSPSKIVVLPPYFADTGKKIQPAVEKGHGL